MIKVIPLFCFNSLRNFTYLVLAEQLNVCIDPYDGELVFNYLKEHDIKLDIILNTHGHLDHTRGNDFLVKHASAKIITPKANEKISLSKRDHLQAIATPGHTMDHLGFLAFEGNEQTFLLAGDTLFNGGVGNCKNGGIKEVLFDTITMLKKLISDQVIIYPGHDYFVNNLEFSKVHTKLNAKQEKFLTLNPKAEKANFPFLTFKEEKAINPFLMLDNKQDFLQLRTLRDQW